MCILMSSYFKEIFSFNFKLISFLILVNINNNVDYVKKS